MYLLLVIVDGYIFKYAPYKTAYCRFSRWPKTEVWRATL